MAEEQAERRGVRGAGADYRAILDDGADPRCLTPRCSVIVLTRPEAREQTTQVRARLLELGRG